MGNNIETVWDTFNLKVLQKNCHCPVLFQLWLCTKKVQYFLIWMYENGLTCSFFLNTSLVYWDQHCQYCKIQGGIFTTILPRGNVGCKRIPVTISGLQNSGNMWKSLWGILVNIFLWEVWNLPKERWPLGFLVLELLMDNIHQDTPKIFPHIL